MGREVEEAEEAKEVEETEDRRPLPPRLFFGDEMHSRIAPTTLARCDGVPIVLRYRKRPGDKQKCPGAFQGPVLFIHRPVGIGGWEIYDQACVLHHQEAGP